MPSGRRTIPEHDIAMYWDLRAKGASRRSAASQVGIAETTAARWESNLDRLKVEVGLGVAGQIPLRDVSPSKRRMERTLREYGEPPDPIPAETLSPQAQRGLTDFDFFRRRYLGRVPSPWQVDAAYKIVDMLRSDDREFLVLNCPPGAGKALSLNTLVPTPDGWTTMGDIVPGQYVYGAHGQPVKVLAKSEVLYDRICYKVTTDDGHSVVADAEHQWLARIGGEGVSKRTGTPDRPGKPGPKTRGVDGWRVQTTEFLARPRPKRPTIPMCAPLHGEPVTLPVDPYTLGVWLGDGHRGTGTITNLPDDAKWMRHRVEAAGYTTTDHAHPYNWGVLALAADLRHAGVLHDKHIPAEYLRAPVAERIALLQGLIDTDGHVDERGRVEFCTVTPRLAEGVAELLHTLGVKARIREGVAALDGRVTGPRYRINFMWSAAASLPRKADRCRDNGRTPNRYLTVEPCESVPVQCIQVEGGLYLAGEGMLVTHNSTLWHDVAVWMIVRDRTIRILIGSISSPLARQYAGRIRDTLGRIVPMKATEEELARGLAVDAEATLAEDYGRFKPRVPAAAWRQDEFVVEQHDGSSTNNKEATVTSYGMDSEFIGHRAELCLFDDAANSDNAREGVGRDRFLEKWDSVAEARCEPGGLLAVIGQRLSAADLYGYCLDKRAVLDDADSDDDGAPLETPKYHHLVYKAYYEELDTGPSSRSVKAAPWPDGPLLDPRRVPWRDLQYVRTSSERRFRLVYQQEDPLLDPELIRREWIFGGPGPDGILYPGCVDKSRSRGQVPTGLAGDVVSIATIDPSPSKYWGITWWLYQPGTDMRYLIDVELRKMTAEELLGWSVDNRAHHGLMEDWQQRSVDLGHRITHWVVEINAAQRFLLAHEFVRRWVAKNRVDILPHTTGRNKIDDDLGVEALLPPVYRAGSISIPYASGGSIDFRVKSFITQAMSWRPDKKQDTDLVMAHWFAELYWPRLSPAKAPPKQWRPSWLRAG
jgi:hypothetical protein